MDKKIFAGKPVYVDVPIGEKVRFLGNPASWPFSVTQAEVRETHMSWVFLVNGFVYKLKKPVSYGLPDFRTIEARLKNCMEELRLNKRLAPEIYLEVVPLFVDESGHLTWIRNGRICDWMVKMVRIPGEEMMDYAIRQQKVSEQMVLPAARHLVQFYLLLDAIRPDADQFLEKMEKEIDGLSGQLQDPAYSFPLPMCKRITDHLRNFIRENRIIFEARIENGFIREVHGDLRPEHIRIGPEPAVIDCLEFSRALRMMDVAEELAYLDMECEMMGDPGTGKLFLRTWIDRAGDPIPQALINFYRIKKALLRTWLVARHIHEPEYQADPKWLKKAGAYLQYGERLLKKG